MTHLPDAQVNFWVLDGLHSSAIDVPNAGLHLPQNKFTMKQPDVKQHQPYLTLQARSLTSIAYK